MPLYHRTAAKHRFPNSWKAAIQKGNAKPGKIRTDFSPSADSDELLSAEDTSSFLLSRLPGLRISAGRAFSPIWQWQFTAQLPVHSDRIARDSHPISYYPLIKRHSESGYSIAYYYITGFLGMQDYFAYCPIGVSAPIASINHFRLEYRDGWRLPRCRWAWSGAKCG